MQLQNRSISRALIIDDDPHARESYEYAIEELELQPHPVEGPLPDLPSFIATLQTSDVLLCDYHLRKRSGYATCDGDQLIAECYKAKVPGVLCTTFTDAILRRDCLRYIPGLIKDGNPNPEDLRRAWDRCLRELNGSFEPWRQPWRTLVRVDEVDHDRQFVYVIVPPWRARQKIRIDMVSLPQEIRDRVGPDRRFHAMVNTGAESHEDLFFAQWETE